MRWGGGAVLVVLLGVMVWLVWWPANMVSVSSVDAGARPAAVALGASPQDPTAAGAIAITAAGAAMVAVRGGPFRRAFAGESALVNGLPAGDYDVLASGPAGSASKKVAVVAGETTRVALMLQPPAGAVVLRGTVRDVLGGTVAGADVWLDLDIVRTDGAGDFDARVLPGDHEIHVRAPGYAETSQEVSFRIDHHVEIVLHPAATVRGVVVHPDGSPAGGARVVARSVTVLLSDTVHDTFADDEGKFVFDQLPGGDFELQASTATEIGIEEHVTVAPTMSRHVRVELAAAIAVFGRVLGADGVQIAGAQVELREGERHRALATTVSGPDGSYRFSPVLPGSVVVAACGEGYLCARSPARFFRKTPAEPFDVIVSAGSTMRLHIVDASGAAVAGAHAYLGDFAGCESDAGGECVLDHLVARRTTVTVDHPTAGHVRDEPLDIGPGENRRTLRLVRGATVRGMVRWDDGKPAVNVEVSGGPLASDPAAHTGPDGRYELKNVEEHSARIRVHTVERADGYRFADSDPSGGAERSVDLVSGEVREGVDFVLRRESKTISGSVVDATGVAVAGAAVGLLREEPRFREDIPPFSFGAPWTYSAADGTFTLENIAEAQYIVWATAEEQPRAVTRQVAAGSTKVVLQMAAPATIEGVVKDRSGAPVSRFDVRLVTGYADRRQRSSQSGGRFILRGVAQGKHTVTVESALDESVGAQCAVEVTIAAGETKHVSCVLERSVTVVGRLVSWPDGQPIAGITLSAEGALRREATPSDAGGRFRVEGLAPGDVRFHTFDVRGHSDEWRRVVGTTSPSDVGDLASGPTQGWGHYRLRTDPNDRFVSVGDRDVTTLGANSLGGVISEAPKGTPVVVKRANGETETLTTR